jgi:hypothetical protein
MILRHPLLSSRAWSLALPVLHQQLGLELLGGRLFGERRTFGECRL